MALIKTQVEIKKSPMNSNYNEVFNMKYKDEELTT